MAHLRLRPSLRARLRVVVASLAVPALLPLLTVALAACGSTQSQLTVSLAPVGATTARPGDVSSWTFTIVNQGPGAASGVRAQLELPAGYQYVSTPQIDKDFLGTTRVQDQDPPKDSASPQWGAWLLEAPSTNADGTIHHANVVIHFQLRAGGTPGDFTVVPRAVSDTVGSDTAGQPVAVHLDPAPDLRLDVSVTPQQLKRDSDVLYRVTVDNLGTGPAGNLSVLLTLPPGINFVRTETIAGNASRDSPVDPRPGTLEVFYGSFTVPARSDSGPGSLVITLRGHCTFCTGGTYTVSAQITDQDGTVVTASDTAPVTILAPSGAPTPVPTPPPTPPPTATPSPSPG